MASRVCYWLKTLSTNQWQYTRSFTILAHWYKYNIAKRDWEELCAVSPCKRPLFSSFFTENNNHCEQRPYLAFYYKRRAALLSIFFVWNYFTKTPTCLTKLPIVAGTIFASANHYLCTYVENYWIRHFPWVYAPCLHITVVLLCCDKIQYFLAPFIRKGLLVAETLRTTNTRPFLAALRVHLVDKQRFPEQTQ